MPHIAKIETAIHHGRRFAWQTFCRSSHDDATSLAMVPSAL
jgi:hypothetical protein